MTGRKRLPADDRRNQVLDATADLIADEGARSVNMEAIAARAGVSKPVVYQFFANAEAVLVALLERYWAQLDAEIESRVADAGDGIRERVQAGLSAYFDIIEKSGRSVMRIVYESTGMVSVEEVRRSRQLQLEDRWKGLIRDRLHLDEQAASLYALIFRTSIEAVTRRWAEGGFDRRTAERGLMGALFGAGDGIQKVMST